MPAHDPTSFSVHVDPDDLARAELTAAVPVPPAADPARLRPTGTARTDTGRPDAARRSEPTRAGRTAAGGRSRSYAFRRS
jgi:hypothetical protein